MASLTDAFTPIWGLAAGELKGIEIAQTDPENANIGTYGWRSLGVPTITAAAGEFGAIALNAVTLDANRANADVRWIRQLKADAAEAYRSGAVVRASGAAGAEEGYFAYVNQTPLTPTLRWAGLTSIVPEVGPNPTSYTRNLAAYVEDFEGLLKRTPIHCARFKGARFVENGLNGTINAASSSESFSGGGWALLSTGTVTVSACPDALPSGATAASRLTAGAAGNPWIGCGSNTTNGGLRTVRLRVTAKRVSGSASFSLWIQGAKVQMTAAMSSDWIDYASAVFWMPAAGAVQWGLALEQNQVIDATKAQIEEVTGQAVTAPSEYVSTGVLAFPYHGTGKDGCKWFATENGNTVASNVVTEATGAAIPAATLKRFKKENAGTNYAIQNRDLTNAAWTKTNCTAAKTATGPDGVTNSASTLTATAANATCLQAIVRASAQRVTGCRIKRRTGSGVINMTQDNGATWTPVTVTGAWTRVAIPAATLANPTIGFQIVANGDAIDVDLVQHEEAAYLSSDIATTTVAVTRPEDQLKFPLSVFSDTAGTAYAEFEAADWANVGNARVIGDGSGTAGAPLMAAAATSGVQGYDGTNSPTGAAGTPSGVVRGASVWGSSAMQVFAAGSPGTGTSYDGGFGLTTVGIGMGSVGFQGHIGAVEIYAEKFSAGQVGSLPRSLTASGSIVLAKLVAGVLTEIGGAEVAMPATEEDYYMLLRANGTALKVKAWRYDAPEPAAWAIDTTDSAISAAGYVGLAFQCLTANNAGFHVPGFVSVGTNGESAPRPRTDAEIRRWVNDDSNERVILVKLGVLGQLANGTANPSQLLVSNRPFVTRGSDDPPDQVFDDIIVQEPTLRAAANEQLLGRSTLSIGDLVIASENGVRDHLLQWNWDGRPCEQYLGGVGWRLWDFFRVMTGTVASVYAPKRGQIGFKLRDMGAVLDKKLQTAVMGGSEADAGAVQPYALGKLFNIEPVLKDASTRRWKFHSASLTGATGITAVRDKGSNAAYTADLANGELTLTTDNVGRVTIDVNNDLAATSAGDTHRKAIRTIIENQAGQGAEACYLGARSGSLATFATAATIGYYARREVNVRDALDEVAISAGGFWYPNTLGLYCAAQLRIPAAPYDHVLLEDDLADDIEIEDIWLPAEAEQLGYQRNWTPQDPDGLASGVTVANRALYGAEAQFTAVAPSYSGLDQPSNHLLRRRLKSRLTLFYAKADAETEAARLDTIFSKTCAIVRFTTRFNGPFFDLGESLHLTHRKYGFSAGRAGVIVGFEKKWRNASATLRLFVQLPGLFPVTTAAAPHPTAEDLY